MGGMKKVLSIILIVASGVVIPTVGVVLAVDDYDEAIEQKESEKSQKEQELEESKYREYLYQQEGLSIAEKLTSLEEDIAGLKAEIENNRSTLAEIGDKVDAKALEIEEKKGNIEDVSGSLYKESRMSLVEVLFSSEGITDLLRQFSFRRFGIASLLETVREFQEELQEVSGEFNSLSDEVAALEEEQVQLDGKIADLESQKVAYQQMAAAEASKQNSLVGQIANITAEQQQLILEKMAATQQSTSIGEYEDVAVQLPDPPFSPAYAVASIGYPHRIGMSQYGAYGRSKAGQNFRQILSAYFNAELKSNYAVPSEINVLGYGWMPFEDQYLKGIAEMPTSWGDSGGYEALKAQAILARTYALHYTNNGQSPICTTQQCQVYYHPKVSDPVAAKWHQAVADTRGQVLVSGGQPITAFYASTAGGYTRLPADFDIWGSAGSNLPYLKRVADVDGAGKAYDGPVYGNSPWYYKVWYAQSDVHPWLTQAEMIDLLNSALLPADYNSYLSHPDLGGWSHEQVRSKLEELGITPISNISSMTVVNSTEGYVASLQVLTSGGLREVNGWRFNNVYKLRSRGYLALWSSLYDIVIR